MAKPSRETITETGIIDVTKRGVGYFLRADKDDVEIPIEALGTALNGDCVEVEYKDRKNPKGKVLKVVERKKTHFVGTLEQERGSWFLVPDDPKMHVNIQLPGAPKSTRQGYKAVVTMDTWDNPHVDPEGSVDEVLGPAGEHETEMRATVVGHGFVLNFPPDVEQAADEISKNKQEILDREIPNRRDMRATTTFTIDPFDAKDFDDAISFSDLGDGLLEVGIHIADVSAYVEEGDPIDQEAQERGTSVYLVDRTIPMLPEVLSNDVCSLNPEEDKLTFSAIFQITKAGEVKDSWFGTTVINSDKRFTYEEAQGILDKGEGLFYEELRTLDALTMKLRDDRLKNGSVDFEQDEVEFELDEKGVPVRVYRKERIRTNMLIEDLMLLANKEVATHVNKHNKERGHREAFVYRIHDLPDPDKIAELAVFLRAIGYDLDEHKGEVSGKALNDLFKQLEGKPEEELIKKATVRSMAKAIYSTKNVGHFGLAFRYYTHFTSPIRRYPDLMVHRIMKRHLDGSEISAHERSRYHRLSVQSSEREVSAVEAERDSIKFKQVEYLSKHVEEEFDAIVASVTDFGMFVEEVTTKADGLVHMSTLKDDYYDLDQKNFRLKGKRGKTFSIGDRVRVRLKKANIEERQLDFVLIQSDN